MEYLLSLVLPSVDYKMISDFDKLFIALGTLIGVVALILALLFVIKVIIFQLYLRCSNQTIQKAVTNVIYELDNLADKLSNKDKRREAIDAVKDLFIWRTIPIPKFVIGVIIDLEVKAIRSVQKSVADEKNPYLHPDDLIDDWPENGSDRPPCGCNCHHHNNKKPDGFVDKK